MNRVGAWNGLAGMVTVMRDLTYQRPVQLTLDLEPRANAVIQIGEAAQKVIRRLQVSGGDAGLRSIDGNKMPRLAVGGQKGDRR
jgi:hypothetical protein